MIYELSTHFAIISIAGSDAEEFLQNQFSNDITLCTPERSQISSYNSPKGRVFATFRIVKADDNLYYLITTREQIEFLIKRLTMFVLRADVKIDSISKSFQILGVDADSAIELGFDSTLEVHNVQNNNDTFIINIGGEAKRYIYLEPESELNKKPTNLANIQDWFAADIADGIPHIFSDTAEEFVAQTINLDLLDGINFKKGCYPGQEVIARMKYLGKVKKRLHHLVFDINAKLQNGENLYIKDKEQSIGQVLYTASEGEILNCLAVLQLESAESSNEVCTQDSAFIGQIKKGFV